MAEDVLARFVESGSRIELALATIGRERYGERPAEGEWSIGEVLAHLADGELLAGERFRRIIADPNATLHALNEVDWAAHLRYEARDPDLALATFRALRTANLEVLRLIDAAGWERTGWHTALGPVTLRQQVETFAEHTAGHAEQLLAIAAQLSGR